MRSPAGIALWILIGCTSAPAAPDAGSAIDAGAVDAARPDAANPPDAASAPDAQPPTDAGPPPPTLDDALARLTDPGATAADLDALLHEIAWTHRWPLTDGTRWLFATRWADPPGDVSLVSDVNSWTPSRAPATRAASGVHHYVVLDAAGFDLPAPGAKYKWHGAPDAFRAPPEATAYGHDAFGPFGYVAPPTDAAWRERFIAFDSAHLDAPRAFRALLPAGFSAGDPARVLFLHDGQNVFDPDAPHGGWRADEALEDPAFADVVVLAVDSAIDRMSAYTHVPDDIGAGGLVGGRADDYARLVTEEALPFFRSRYGVDARGDDLVIGGSSLGGLVSLHLALTEPVAMRCVIAMSSTLGWGAFADGASGADALVRWWSGHGSVAIYLDSGGGGTCADADGDGVDEDSDDADNFCTTNQLRDRLADLGYAFDVDLFHWHEPGAPHTEAAWAARLPRALEACAAAGWSAL
ncbi:MAG TPA: alpha/beta hydrolase-fold protein [Sandaracinaceae bacterium LLY-WYZ-13_1]|nr:alpha/beta hydrolase-fold protein [Sandaracinaceae bacterium LLY-WYZ-13_1]